jgi:leucyl-tRNA synthetase
MENYTKIEKKWKQYWIDHNTFVTDVWDFSKPKYYVLDMFPYPSGVGLHAGHVEGYTATDIIARMKRMQGYNVLHPMGWDAFGLPAEQFAIKTGNHPWTFTKKNIATFKEQLTNLGFSFDWTKEVATCDPEYYKWTQWIFKSLFNDGLAKQIDMPVNWCEGLGTVLANDEVIDGKSERGGYPVVKKNMKQWVIDIPKYSEKLLEGLNDINWPESTKEMQRNWIGKSIGAEVEFKIKDSNEEFIVFTTRPDTLFGATYCVLSPEHPLVNKITTEENKKAVLKYQKECAKKTESERTEDNKEKTGVFTGSYAINPVNGESLPIWISDYVLITYGTGAIMAVPAHDTRDYEFAKKFNIPIIEVIKGGDISKEAYTGDGIHINSEFLNGLDKEQSINKIISWLVDKKLGKKKINYRMREWIFARQRYWGEPIPILYDDENNTITLDDKDLPLILPELENYSPSKEGVSPLERATDWVNVIKNGKHYKRETSTMPGSAASSWYFLRYLDPKNDKEIADKKLIEHWMPVDLYVGGPEHAVGHLLYSRMWNNYLYDKGISSVKEPFIHLVHQGMVLGANGIKMGKRYPEFSINPNDIVKNYGADTIRLYEMFMGPLESDKPWNNNGVTGAKKFLDRIWRLYTEEKKIQDKENKNLEKVYNETIKKVTEDYETLNINTAISQMMIFINAVYKEDVYPKSMAENFLKILNPITPFITEELWEKLGHNNTISYEKWPTYDISKTKEEQIEIGIQVNGKLRGSILSNLNETKDDLLEKAMKEDNVKKYVEGKTVVKTIVIPGKIVNIVIK